MVGRILAAICAIALFPIGQVQGRVDLKEKVRGAYVQFVEAVNALSTTVMPGVMTPEVLSKLQGLSANETLGSRLAEVTILSSDVLSVTPRYGMVIANRTIHWSPQSGKDGDEKTDSILAVLTRQAHDIWKFAWQCELSPNGAFKLDASRESSQFKCAQATLESVLGAITAGNRAAVEKELSYQRGRTLTGEIGTFLQDAHKKKIRWDELDPVGASDDTCIAIAKITSLDLPDDPRQVGMRTVSRSLLVFKRSGANEWKLDAELVCDL